MIKRMTAVLAGLFFMLGITAAPASAASSGVLVEQFQAWGQVAFGGDGDLRNIPSSCQTEETFENGIQSAQNLSEVTTLVFYADDGCQIQLAVLAPLTVDPVIISPVTLEGALSYEAVA